jgi:DNA polymerase-3 subunit alpha
MTNFASNFSSYYGCIPFGLILPEVKIDEKYYKNLKISDSSSNFDFLKNLCYSNLNNINFNNDLEKDKYEKRLNEELGLFYELNFTDYLLITWDILNFCHENNIPTGLGRGSAAGSLTLFLIGVTGIDPIKYNLYFERFVSRARAKQFQVNGVKYLDGSLMCDIDNDISYDRRQEVIDYIYKKYPDYVSSITTFATLSGKLCIKECYKIIEEVSEEEAQSIANSIPKIFGKVMSLKKASKESEKFLNWCLEHEKVFKISKQLEGLIKNTSVHPSGIAIGSKKIEELCPISYDESGRPIAGYEMDTVSNLMIKVDILGLRTLSVIDDVCKRININWKSIDINHPSIYSALQILDCPKGIFQIEADATYQVCRKVKPSNIFELSDVIALSRPGAMGFVDEYVDIKNENKIIPQRHPVLDKILKETKGIIIYQESLMKIAHEVFGFSLEDAEILRRIVGKKKRQEIKKWESKIQNQAKKTGLDKSIVDFYWKSLSDSADYSFNASHSISYAALSAITIYLKFNYPQEFFISLLKMSQFEPKPHEEIRIISNELKNFNIELLPPDLALSKMDFTIDNKNIRYGLSSIKGISDKSLESIYHFRSSDKPNKFEIFLAAKEAGLNVGALSALIQAGTLTGYTQKRSRTVLEAQCFNLLTDREKRNLLILGEKYNYDLLNAIKECYENKIIADDQKILFKDSRFYTLKEKIIPYKKIYEQNSKYENFANWYFEKQLLGYSHNLKLKTIMGEEYKDSEDIPNMMKWSKHKMIGTVEMSKKSKSTNGNLYIILNIFDDSGSFKALLCDNNRYKKCTEYLESGKKIPEKDDIVVLIGSKSDDGTIFIDDMSIMTEKIYLKLKDLE